MGHTGLEGDPSHSDVTGDLASLLRQLVDERARQSGAQSGARDASSEAQLDTLIAQLRSSWWMMPEVMRRHMIELAQAAEDADEPATRD